MNFLFYMTPNQLESDRKEKYKDGSLLTRIKQDIELKKWFPIEYNQTGNKIMYFMPIYQHLPVTKCQSVHTCGEEGRYYDAH